MSTPLEAWALAAMQSLAVFHEDVGNPEKPAQLELMAKAMVQAAREQKGWQGSRQQLVAAEIAVAYEESRLSLRIHRNECKPKECDPKLVKGEVFHQAISSFQLHSKPLSDPKLFPLLGGMTFDSTLLAAKEASRALVRSRGWCASVPDDQVAMMFTAYAGQGCQLDRWPGWRARVNTYQRVLRVPVPKATDSGGSQKQGS